MKGSAILYAALAILATALVLLVLSHETGQVAGMASDDFARLAYGAALATVIGSAVLLSYRGRLSLALRHALIWIAAGLVLVTLYAYRAPLQQAGRTILTELVPGRAVETMSASGAVELRLKRRADGHFGASVSVNGTRVTMLVDTGASLVTLSQAHAVQAGFDPAQLSYTVPVMTANGRAMAAPVRLDTVSLGTITASNLRALVTVPGALNESLLGINFLNSVGSYEVRGDVMTLRAQP